jgi:hypothetical protein
LARGKGGEGVVQKIVSLQKKTERGIAVDGCEAEKGHDESCPYKTGKSGFLATLGMANLGSSEWHV